jgi:hypothetical protein
LFAGILTLVCSDVSCSGEVLVAVLSCAVLWCAAGQGYMKGCDFANSLVTAADIRTVDRYLDKVRQGLVLLLNSQLGAWQCCCCCMRCSGPALHARFAGAASQQPPNVHHSTCCDFWQQIGLSAPCSGQPA